MNRYAVSLALPLMLCSGIPIEVSALTIPQEPPGPMAIAVLDLDANNIEEGEARAITERLRVKLTEKRDIFEVVERNRMESILSEVGFQLSGACNTDECVVQVGQILGVRKMVAGSVSRVGILYTLQVRIVDVTTGRIEEVAYEDVSGIEQVLTLATGNVADKLAAAFSGPTAPLRQEEPSARQEPVEQEEGQTTPPAADWRQDAHHDGWVARLGTCFTGGTATRTEDATGTDVTIDISGGGSGWEFMIGKAIRPDFLWFFITSRTEISGPEITASGAGSITADSDDLLGLVYTGLGITFYLEPQNWWGSLAVVSTTYDYLVAATDSKRTFDSATGLYLALGRDWWVWKRFNFGLSARLVNSENVSLFGLGASFTADLTRSR
ncbi:CsgG/HfaB family protein [Candidatus Zixiibacteriota bacterium]